MLLEAHDAGLITCITDNGAGGLSSSIGEMAEYTNGCRIDLAKYHSNNQVVTMGDLSLRESRRMTVAINPKILKHSKRLRLCMK